MLLLLLLPITKLFYPFGYNGDERGGANKPDSLEIGKSNFIHAEVNAVTKMNYSDPRSRKIYLTHSPCIVCAKLMVNAKISKVIYSNEYRDTKGLDILRSHGIVCEHFRRTWDE